MPKIKNWSKDLDGRTLVSWENDLQKYSDVKVKVQGTPGKANWSANVDSGFTTKKKLIKNAPKKKAKKVAINWMKKNPVPKQIKPKVLPGQELPKTFNVKANVRFGKWDGRWVVDKGHGSKDYFETKQEAIKSAKKQARQSVKSRVQDEAVVKIYGIKPKTQSKAVDRKRPLQKTIEFD